MNKSRTVPVMGLLLFVSGVIGCADGGAFALRKPNAPEYSPLLAEAAAEQQIAIDDIEANPTPTSPVSRTSGHQITEQSLITLPKGGDLDTHINSADGPVLLDFFADWCGPCRAQSKILHDIADTAADTHTRIIKINVDEHQQIAQQLQVSSLPTLVMIRDGEIVQRQSGIMRKPRLEDWMR